MGRDESRDKDGEVETGRCVRLNLIEFIVSCLAGEKKTFKIVRHRKEPLD